MKIDYRLALDLGTNSIGWCVYRIAGNSAAAHEAEQWKIVAIQRMGVRIFSDGRNPKDLASLAASRRVARQARRRRDRALKRKQQLLNQLVEFGLMPADSAERKKLTGLDPYELRAKGLTEPLHPHHFGRALFHLARKRGFRSGRKDLQTEDSEKEFGKIDNGIKSLAEKLKAANCNTVGQYLAQLHSKRQPVLARQDIDGNYPIYLARELVADEFDRLWLSQQTHHPDLLTSRARDSLRDTILFQRKLKPVAPGKCLFERNQPRALLAHPLAQRFRILQELANLRIRLSASQECALRRDERNKLLFMLTGGDSSLSRGLLSWARLRSALGLPKHADFNLNTSGRKGLKADNVSISLSMNAAIGSAWHERTSREQNDFLLQLRKADRRTDLPDVLAGMNLTESQLDAVFRVAATMPDDFGGVSLAALQKIVPALESDVISYSDAVKRAGYDHHSMFYDGEVLDELPYYGQRLPGYTQPRDLPGANPEEREHGRIPNPTVHVGLNQLRKVVNAIIRRYGHPKQITIEVARDFGLSGENRRKLEKQQLENRERNERYGEELINRGIKNSRENRQRLQLFEEIAKNDPLGAECIYTGERISPTKLFSDEIEIDHILPFSRSLDDGIGNKVLCVRRANRQKAQQTPFEAFGRSSPNDRWSEILARAERLVPRKAKRFLENALEEFLKDNDFLARHLNDTAYFSRVAREYLTAICPPNCVWVSTGRLTSMLRGKWGLNRILSDADRKDRTDHRHHAVDAAVIGACDRSLIKAMADAARRAEGHGESRLLEGLSPPWTTFFDDLKAIVERVVVSHKPDHGHNRSMHDELPFGVRGRNADNTWLAVKREPVTTITASQLQDGEKKYVYDNHLRRQLRELLSDVKTDSERVVRLESWSRTTGIKRIRLAAAKSLVELPNAARNIGRFVATQGNACFEITRSVDGGWHSEISTYLDVARATAQQPAILSQWNHSIQGFPLVMRVRKGDVLAVGDASNRLLFLVVELRARSRDLGLADIKDAGDNVKLIFRGLGWLRENKARLVKVDEIGYVNDPGFRE